MDERRKQADRILALLKSKREVSLPEIMSLGIASHTRRISDLRVRGYDIRMHDLWDGPIRKVWYTLTQPKGQVKLFDV